MEGTAEDMDLGGSASKGIDYEGPLPDFWPLALTSQGQWLLWKMA